MDIATTAAVQTNLLLLHLAYAEWPVAWKVAGPGGKGAKFGTDVNPNFVTSSTDFKIFAAYSLTKSISICA